MNTSSNFIAGAGIDGTLSLGECEVDLGRHRISRGEKVTRASPKAIAVLKCLIDNAGQTVSRERLLAEVWNSLDASDELLTQSIKELRRAFRDSPRAPRYIETVPKGGYRLLATIASRGNERAIDLRQGLRSASPANDAPNDAQHLPTSQVPARSFFNATTILPLLGLAIIAIAIGANLLARNKPVMSQSAHTRTLTSGYDEVEFPSLSPEGTLVAYSARRPNEADSHIFIQTGIGSPPLPIETSPGASDTYPVWSADGNWLAFLRVEAQQCRIHVVAATGGASRSVGNCLKDAISYFDWTPDGANLVTQGMEDHERHLSLRLLNLSDGSIHAMDYERDENADDLNPHFSPDGTRVAFRRGQNPFSDIYVMNADGRDLRRVTDLHTAITGFTWLSSNDALLFSGNFEGGRKLFKAEISTGRVTATSFDDAIFPSASAKSNKVAMVQDRTATNLAEYAIATDAGDPVWRAPSTGIDLWPAYSSKGQSLCFVSDRSGSSQLWLSRADSSEAIALTQLDQGETLSSPTWRPDDTHILVVAQSKDRSRLVDINVESHQAREINLGGANVRAASYSPDGKSLDVVSNRTGEWQLWRFTPASNEFRLLVKAPIVAFQHGSGESIYFTQADFPGLYRNADGDSSLVTNEIDTSNRLAWQLTEDGVYFVQLVDSRQANLRLLAGSDRESRVVRPLANFGAETAIAISGDRARMTVPSYAHLASKVRISELQ